MLLRLLCVFSIMQAKGFILKYPHNIRTKNGANYNIIETNLHDDLGIKELTQTNVHVKNNQLNRLNKIASKDYEKHLNTSINLITDKRQDITLVARMSSTTTDLVVADVTPHTKHRVRKIHNKQYINYDYDELLHEYYDKAINEAKSNETYFAAKTLSVGGGILENLNIIVPVESSKRNKSAVYASFTTCLFLNCDKTQLPEEAAVEYWNFVKVWLYVYILIAVLLWCTKGWCCCCLYCKSFKPNRTIENAKMYLILNPPGVLCTNGKETVYDPTEEEKNAYEVFEHTIRTI